MKKTILIKIDIDDFPGEGMAFNCDAQFEGLRIIEAVGVTRCLERLKDDLNNKILEARTNGKAKE